MALGIVSLGDMQLEAALLPAQSRLTVYITAAPVPDVPAAPENMQAAEKTVSHAPPVPVREPCVSRGEKAPVLQQSYYLAHYQAFHYSDRAG